MILNYETGFSVFRLDGIFRRSGKGVYFEDDCSLLLGMNGCQYDYTLEVLSELDKLNLEILKEYEWGGGERAWFVSNKESTIVIDNFGWIENFEVPTSEVFKMMLSRKKLMDEWSKERITNLIRESFITIRSNPAKHVESKKGCRYKLKTAKSGLVVKLIIEESDLKLSDDQYVETLKFDDRYFNPSSV